MGRKQVLSPDIPRSPVGSSSLVSVEAKTKKCCLSWAESKFCLLTFLARQWVGSQLQGMLASTAMLCFTAIVSFGIRC